MGSENPWDPIMHRIPLLPVGQACVLALSLLLAPGLNAQTAAPADAESHKPPTSAKLNSLAHLVLEAGLKSNALADEKLPPWHIKIDYEMRDSSGPKPVSGTVEEWHAGPFQWSRTYTSRDGSRDGDEWSTSRTEQFLGKRGMNAYAHHFMTLRVTRPVLDPLYQAANIKPEYEMRVFRTTTAGVTLNCTSVVDGSRYVEDVDYLFATSCFDQELHLRLTVAGDTSVEFDDVQPFEGRAVARDVKVIQHGVLLAEMKVSVLEPLANGKPADMQPPSNAIPEPYTIEAGFPAPEAVYQVAASLPLAPSGKPFAGVVPVPFVIHKDGTVKVNRSEMDRIYPVLADALENAVNRWKYKPYVVDGQPVEVAYGAAYPIDGKPFVPVYDRPKPKPVVTAPEDFSSAYDAKRDPEKDLALAEAQATQGHKRILMEVGGTWCSWCRILDKYFDEHADLRGLRDTNFVLLKVNMGPSNENQSFLARYPAIPGYPWIFVLDEHGKLLYSEDTNGLEDRATGYSSKAIKDFLTTWKPS